MESLRQTASRPRLNGAAMLVRAVCCRLRAQITARPFQVVGCVRQNHGKPAVRRTPANEMRLASARLRAARLWVVSCKEQTKIYMEVLEQHPTLKMLFVFLVHPLASPQHLFLWKNTVRVQVHNLSCIFCLLFALLCFLTHITEAPGIIFEPNINTEYSPGLQL